MPSDDRERSFENALASHVRASSSAGVPGNPCADAEMLAAYHHGSLPPEQIASLKTHVTTCSRCQEILALLEATDEIPLAAADVPGTAVAAAKSAVHPFPARKPTLWRWVAPAGALAAALLVWVAVQENNSVRLAKQGSSVDLTQTQIAKARPASPPPVTPPSLDATEKREAPSPDAFRASHAVSPSQITPAPRQRAQSPAKEKDSLKSRRESPAGAIADRSSDTSPKPVTPPASEQSLQSLAPRGGTETVNQDAANQLAKTDEARTELAQAELERKSANDKHAAALFRSAPSAPTMAAAALDPSLGETGVMRRLASNIGAVTVSAPGRRVSWRIGQAGVILFSPDAGKTWIVQPSGILTDLLAGSAPSAKTCWIVGRSGTILRTIDGGKHWRKVNPPTQDDFRSVSAVDARQATVSLANGSYQTTDGGATWNKLPPE
jgi:Photosynthesis system II assembly factor YCF48/Putative zinc-finger